MESKSLIVIGSSNLDLVLKLDRLPKPGETIIGNEFLKSAGGKGCNQAVAAKRAGADIKFISGVGKDHFGKETLDNLIKDNIDTGLINIFDDEQTGIALIFVDQSGENSIGIASGANSKILPEILDNSTIDQIKTSEFILTQLEIPLKTIEFLTELAANSNSKLILNPAPAQKLSHDIYRNLFLITPNEHEAKILTGIEVNDEKSASKAAEYFLSLGVKNVIITMGEKGCFLKFEEFTGILPSFKVKAVDTTAAGDVFNGALAAALIEKKSFLESAIFASAAAAISVTIAGAQTSIPFRATIDDFLKKII